MKSYTEFRLAQIRSSILAELSTDSESPAAQINPDQLPQVTPSEYFNNMRLAPHLRKMARKKLPPPPDNGKVV